MGAELANTTNDFRAAFDEQKQEVGVVAQAAPPGEPGRLFADPDFNALQVILVAALRRIRQHGAMNGATKESMLRIEGLGTANNFRVYGGGTDFETTGNYYVNGIPIIAPFANANFSASSDPMRWLHRKASAVTAIKLVDEDALLAPGVLAGRELKVLTGATLSTYTLRNNTEREYIIDAGDMVVDGHAAGSLFWVMPSTPSGAGRVDKIYLDAYIAGVSPAEDPSLLVNLEGTPVETTHRLRVVQSLWVEQQNKEALQMVVVDAAQALYTYTDLNLHQHFVVEISQLVRYNGKAEIDADDVDDVRSYAGAAAHDMIKRFAYLQANGCILYPDSLAPSKNGGNAAQLDIGQGWFIQAQNVTQQNASGVQYTPARSFTRPTGGSTWAFGGTVYHCYVDGTRTRRLIVSTTPPPDESYTYICSFAPTAANNIGTVIDQRKILAKVAYDLATNAAGQLRVPLKFANAVPAAFYDDTSPTSVLKGRVGYDLETSGTLLDKFASAAADSVPAFHGQKVTGGGLRGTLVDAAHNGTADTDVSANGLTAVLGVGVFSADGVTAPDVAYLNAVKTDKLVAPAHLYGNLAASGNKLVPITTPHLIIARRGSADMCRFDFTGATTAKPLSWDNHALMMNLDTAAPALIASATNPFWSMDLPFPRGTKLSSIKLHFYNQLAAAATLQLSAKLYALADGGGTFTSGNPTTMRSELATKSFATVLSNANTNAVHEIEFAIPADLTFSGSEVNPHRVLQVALVLESLNWVRAAGGGVVTFNGYRCVPSIRGHGVVDTGANYVTAPYCGG